MHTYNSWMWQHVVGIIDTVRWTDAVNPQSRSSIFLRHVPIPFLVLILSCLCCLPLIFCWCYVQNSRQHMWEKERALLMKNYSATPINNLWTDSSLAHIFLITLHEAFEGFDTSVLLFWKSFLVFDTANRFFCPQSQKQFSHLFLSHFASRAGISTRTIWVRMLTHAPIQVWNLHKCTNPGRMVKLSRCPGCPDKQHMGGGGGSPVLFVDKRAGLHYLQCTAHW